VDERNVGGLVGRDPELALANEWLDRVRAGAGGVLLVRGDAGIGKTALIDDVVAAATRAGIVVFATAARRLERARPLGPLRDVIGDLDQRPQSWDPTVRMSIDSGSDFAAVDSFADRFESLLKGEPGLVVLDDAHWADAATVTCLRALAVRLVGAGSGFVIATRPLAESHPLSRQLDEIAGEVDVVELGLGGLSPESAAELAERFAAPDTAIDTSEVVARASGNPLLIEALAGRPESTHGSETDPIRGRLAELDESTLDVMRLAAILGSTIDIRLLSELGGAPAPTVIAALRQARDAGLVVEDDGYRFRHDLFQEVLYEATPLAERQALHLAAARMLARIGAPSSDTAEHFRRGALPGDMEAVAVLHEVARSIVGTSPSAAMELFDAAMALSAGNVSVELLADRLQAQAWTGDLDGADAVGKILCDRSLPPDIAYRVHHELAFITFVRGEVHETIEHLTIAASATLDPALHARAVAERALAQFTAIDLAGSRETADEALAAGTASGDTPAIALATCVLSWNALFGLDLATAWRHAQTVTRLTAGPTGREVQVYQPLVFAALVALETERDSELDQLLREAYVMSAATGTVWAVPLYDAIGAFWALRRGRLADARAGALAGSELSEAAGAFAGNGWCLGFLAQLEILAGDLAEAESYVARAEAEYGTPQAKFGPEQVALARAWLLERRGDTTAAVAHLRAAWEFFVACGFDSARPALVGDLARLAALEEDAELVDAVVADAQSLANRSGLEVHAACAARAAAWRELDAQAMRSAAERLEAVKHLTAAALTTVDAARIAELHGDRMTARAFYGSAAEQLNAIGAVAESERIRNELPRGRGRRPRMGWDALTDTEQRVVQLVADGLSNPEIATELYVSRRTVESHVAAALRKLEARSRGELASRFHRRAASGS
jgi:DNA-binding NarL/FixJ family response regulator